MRRSTHTLGVVVDLTRRAALVALCGVGLVACGESSSSGSGAASGGTSGGGSAGVAQPGAQDFGLFRDVLSRGQLPSPDLLDDMGFFAEHKLDYPTATCEGSVCLHGLVGVMGNMINGVDCTLVQVGLNSPLDPAELPRRPLHAVLVVDTSGSMGGEPLAYLQEGLSRLGDSLDDDDTLSLVSYGDNATVVLEHLPVAQSIELEKAVAELASSGRTNIYQGLMEGYRLAEAYAGPDVETRVVLLSDGIANAGIATIPALAGLAASEARRGIGLTTIGVGTSFQVELMRRLAEAGAGNFYFLESPKAMVEVFEDELATALTPIALNLRLEANLGAAYALGDAYGTRNFERVGNDGVVELPAVFLATRRSSAEPINSGRRGGGGAILFELLRRREATSALLQQVGELRLSYTDALTGEAHEEVVTLELPSQAADEVVPEDGWFSAATVEKAFVMLNLYVAFESAAELARDSDTVSASRLLAQVGDQVEDWLGRRDDADIAADLETLDQFVKVLKRFNGPQPAVYVPPNPWPYD